MPLPPLSSTYYTRSVWHVEECRCTQVRCTLLHQLNLVVKSPTTPGQFDMSKNADVLRSDVPLFHQLNLVVKSPTTPGQFDMSKNADVLRSDVPLLHQLNLVVKSPTTPGQFDPLPHSQLDLVVQSSTTSGQFDMWKNADIPRSDVPPPSIKPSDTVPYYTRSVWPPPSIKPSGKEPYYTRSVWHVEECRCIQVRCTTPSSIKPSGTEPYYIRSVWHVKKCRLHQVRCIPPQSNLVVQSPTTPGQFNSTVQWQYQCYKSQCKVKQFQWQNFPLWWI